MARKMKRSRTEYESRGPSDDDDMPVEETTPPRRSSEAQRCSTKKNKNKGKVIKILVKLKNETSEMRKLFGNLIQSNNNQSKMLEKLFESHTYHSKNLEMLTESHNDLRKQWEFHTNSPRSQWNQEQPPRYRLVFKSNVTVKVEKGQTIEIHVALVDVNNGQTVKNGPLASATVELVVIDAKFNENDKQYNWSTEDFMSSIKKARQVNSATVNVDQSGKSIVSNGRFNLENGDKRHCDFTIFCNSSNKKVRLGVMVVSPTPERVLEGLSNPFFVRGHDRPNRRWGITHMLGGQHQSLSQRNIPVLSTEPPTRQQHQVPHWSTVNEAWNNRIGVRDGCPEQNGPMPNMHNPVWQNSTQGLDTIAQTELRSIRNTDMPYTEPSASEQQVGWIPQNQDHWQNLTHQPMNNGTGTAFYTNQRAFPVHLVWDTPNVGPSKHCFHLLDQLRALHSWQPKFYNSGLPTACLMQKHFASLTTMPKEVMQTRRESGVRIEPLEPDGSDEGRPLKRKLHSKYQLRFVNKVCETYYTWDQIKADEGNLLKVALFDENNTKIRSGPLSSASFEIVALHGDFNCDGQDYWTSEEFNRSVVCPPPGEEASSVSVLAGDRILVLADGEACLSDAFFQRTSICARTGMFRMGVMLASAQDERVQEGISEPFRVMDNRIKGFNPAAATLLFPRNTVTETIQQQASMPHQISHLKTRSAAPHTAAMTALGVLEARKTTAQQKQQLLRPTEVPASRTPSPVIRRRREYMRHKLHLAPMLVPSIPSWSFLQRCFLCQWKLTEGMDIYMYRFHCSRSSSLGEALAHLPGMMTTRWRRRREWPPKRIWRQVIFRGTYWLRFWAQLQRDDLNKNLLSSLSTKIEMVSLQQANGGWKHLYRLC